MIFFVKMNDFALTKEPQKYTNRRVIKKHIYVV